VAGYKVLLKASAAKEIEAISSKKALQRIVSRIEALADGPRPHGSQKLAGHRDRYRVRQGSYRVVYSVNDADREVVVFKVGHRREVYR
jgi:mRNA interferase RelE/StbE